MSHPVDVTDDTFDADVLKAEVPVLVDFWADWCAPCKMIAPIVEDLAEEYDGRVKFAKLDVDSNPRTAMSYGVRGIPPCSSSRRCPRQPGSGRGTQVRAQGQAGRVAGIALAAPPPAPCGARTVAQSGERMGPGGSRGLQIRWSRPCGRDGGFDSLSLPPDSFLKTPGNGDS